MIKAIICISQEKAWYVLKFWFHETKTSKNSDFGKLIKAFTWMYECKHDIPNTKGPGVYYVEITLDESETPNNFAEFTRVEMLFSLADAEKKIKELTA